jgi:hypothetical protein
MNETGCGANPRAGAPLTGGGVAISEVILVVLGLGIGVSFPNLTTAIQNAVERADLGATTASAAFFRSLGGAVGVALSGAILTARLPILMPGGTGSDRRRPNADCGACGRGRRLPARPFNNLSCGGDHRSDCVPAAQTLLRYSYIFGLLLGLRHDLSCLGQVPMCTLRQRCRCANIEAQSTAEINSPKFDDLAAPFVQLYRSSAGRTPPPTRPAEQRLSQ